MGYYSYISRPTLAISSTQAIGNIFTDGIMEYEPNPERVTYGKCRWLSLREYCTSCLGQVENAEQAKKMIQAEDIFPDQGGGYFELGLKGYGINIARMEPVYNYVPFSLSEINRRPRGTVMIVAFNGKLAEYNIVGRGTTTHEIIGRAQNLIEDGSKVCYFIFGCQRVIRVWGEPEVISYTMKPGLVPIHQYIIAGNCHP